MKVRDRWEEQRRSKDGKKKSGVSCTSPDRSCQPSPPGEERCLLYMCLLQHSPTRYNI